MMSLTGPLVTEEKEGGTKEEKEGEKEGEIGTRRASNEESQISSPFPPPSLFPSRNKLSTHQI